MGLTASRVMRLLAISALTALSQFGIPSAHAVSPPKIDDRWLPKPAFPAPPRSGYRLLVICPVGILKVTRVC